MTDHAHRFANRVPDTDWAEVTSNPDGHSLAVGHLKDVSEGGLSLDLPVCLQPGAKVQVKLSKLTHGGLLRHFQFKGTVVHAETFGQGCVHGIKFTDMTPAEQTALMDYLCEVEYRTAS
ncbi:MAG: PilZ domain-containing protein [Nitrospirae bacterium]|nr:PilZ domain-containing protein [Nitrospirota bacterium]